jgi:hypothetical protein
MTRCRRAAPFGVEPGALLDRDAGGGAHAAPASCRPQRRLHALLATADGRAIASWGRWTAQGRWVWRWKNRIDRAFVRGFDAAAIGLPAERRGSSDRGAAD